MLSVGIDSVEISRIAKSAKIPRFLEKVYGKKELDELSAKGLPAQSLAACFCAKEAFGKALGTGIRGFKLTEVELLHEKSGKPYLKLSGKARELAERICKNPETDIKVSVTHTRELASVIVIIIGGAENGCPDI